MPSPRLDCIRACGLLVAKTAPGAKKTAAFAEDAPPLIPGRPVAAQFRSRSPSMSRAECQLMPAARAQLSAVWIPSFAGLPSGPEQRDVRSVAELEFPARIRRRWPHGFSQHGSQMVRAEAGPGRCRARGDCIWHSPRSRAVPSSGARDPIFPDRCDGSDSPNRRSSRRRGCLRGAYGLPWRAAPTWGPLVRGFMRARRECHPFSLVLRPVTLRGPDGRAEGDRSVRGLSSRRRAQGRCASR